MGWVSHDVYWDLACRRKLKKVVYITFVTKNIVIIWFAYSFVKILTEQLFRGTGSHGTGPCAKCENSHGTGPCVQNDIIRKDFFLPSWMGSHVKSDYQRTTYTIQLFAHCR